MTGLADTIKDKAGAALHAAGDAAHGAGRAAEALGQGAAKTAERVWHGAVDGARSVAAGVKQAAADVKRGVSDAEAHIKDAVRHGDPDGGAGQARADIAKGVGKGLADVWHGLAEGAHKGLQANHEAVREAGAAIGHAYDAGVDGAARATADLAGHDAGEAVRHAAETAAVPVRTTAGFMHGAAGGFVRGAEGMVRGAGDLVVGAVRVGTDAEYRDKLVAKAADMAEAIGNTELAALRDPSAAAHKAGEAAKGAIQHVKQEGEKAAKEGRLPEHGGDKVGRAAFEVLSLLVPATKAGRAGQAMAATERAGELAGGAKRAADVAGDVGQMAAKAAPEGEAGALAARRAAGDAGPVPPKASPPPAAPDGAGTAAAATNSAMDKAALTAARNMASLSATGTATANDLRMVTEHLARHAPPGTMEALEKKGLKIVVARDDVLQHRTDLVGKQAPGAPDGVTYGEAKPLGLYSSERNEFVAVTVQGKGGYGLPPGSPGLTVDPIMHEYAHAIDFNLGAAAESNLGKAGKSSPISSEEVFGQVCLANKAAIKEMCPKSKTLPEKFAELYTRYMRDSAEVAGKVPDAHAYFQTLSEQLAHGGPPPITIQDLAPKLHPESRLHALQRGR